MRKTRKNKDKLLESILPGVIRDRGWEMQLDLHSIFPNWKSIVPGDAAERAVPQKIVKGTLWLEVENSAWLQQLQFQKIMLLEAINGYLKKSQVRDIRFVLPGHEEKGKKEEPKVRFVSPPPEQLKQFEEQVSFIEDREIRESLIRLWYLSKACVREKK